MTDAYNWSSDSRPRAELRITARRGDDREVDVSVDEPTAEQVTDAVAAFERLAGVLITGGAA